MIPSMLFLKIEQTASGSHFLASTPVNVRPSSYSKFAALILQNGSNAFATIGLTLAPFSRVPTLGQVRACWAYGIKLYKPKFIVPRCSS